MKYQLRVAAACLFFTLTASTQIRTHVDGSVVLRRPISDAEARRLSTVLERRDPAKSIVVDPEALRSRVVDQPPPVQVVGDRVTPAESSPPPAEATPVAPTRTRVEFVRTSPADDRLLQRAIAGQDALRPALSGENSSLITLPGLVRMSTAEGPDLQLKPFVLVNQPLQRNGAGMFEGELLVGVSEIVDTGTVRELPTPLLFQVVGAYRSSPDNILVGTTSPPFQRVRVQLRNVQSGAAELQIFSVIDRSGTKISLPIEGELRIETDSAAIEGLGLAKTRVHVSLSGVPNAAGRRVVLHVEPSGFLDRSVLKLDEDGAADTEIRSDGVGRATIRATVSGFNPATTTVSYRLPLLTLGASMLGGLLGSFISFSTAPKRKRGAWMRPVGAALFGVFVFVLYVIGINLLPVKPQVTVGTAFVFAISALAAWLGPTVANWRKKLPRT